MDLELLFNTASKSTFNRMSKALLVDMCASKMAALPGEKRDPGQLTQELSRCKAPELRTKIMEMVSSPLHSNAQLTRSP